MGDHNKGLHSQAVKLSGTGFTSSIFADDFATPPLASLVNSAFLQTGFIFGTNNR